MPLVNLHTAIGLLIIGWMMFRRSDFVLRKFGIGIGVFALPFAFRALVLLLHPDDPNDSE